MFSHVVIGADDLAGAKAFYDAVLGVMGAPPGSLDPKGRLVYQHGGARLLVTRPIDGRPASVGNGGTVGFRVASPALVDAWHAAGLVHGGTACEDPPGMRVTGLGEAYLAYLRDPAGNKLCAVHRPAA